MIQLPRFAKANDYENEYSLLTKEIILEIDTKEIPERVFLVCLVLKKHECNIYEGQTAGPMKVRNNGHNSGHKQSVIYNAGFGDEPRTFGQRR